MATLVTHYVRSALLREVADRFYWFLLGSLGVWRITHALNSEDGPWNSFTRLRKALEGTFLPKVLGCFYCLSLWVSAPLAIWLGASIKERFLLWLATSAGAILLNHAIERLEDAAPAEYLEHEGVDRDVVLR